MTQLEQFRQLVKEIKSYQYVLNVLGWDSETEAPRDSFGHRAEMLATISAELFRRSTSQEYQGVVNALFADREQLDAATAREISRAKKDLDKIVKIPEADFVGYQKLLNLTQIVWEDAKAKSDYASFKNNLAEIIRYQLKFIGYYGLEAAPYDVLLDEFEDGMTMAEYDRFFDLLKRELVPFVRKILEVRKSHTDPFAGKIFPQDRQEKFSRYLLDVMKFDRNRGLLKKSVHPFTWNTSPVDVRLTTRYQENDPFYSIYSTIHELGHATYEQQIDTKWSYTLISGGTSMGIHESQSRMFENTLGRSRAFWSAHLPKFRSLFLQQMRGVTLDDIVYAANAVEASLIRTEADELTYPLHIMVRYDIEQMLISGRLSVDELPAKWNELMTSYLGVTPKNDAEGVLQDVHWSFGMIGYFPTYALGSAYAAQIYQTMAKDLDIEKILRAGDMTPINAWLKERIHQFGGSKSPQQLLQDVTGEAFNAQYYIEYLKKKYTALYLK
ncbi:MAG: carboxypeptidase M32 [bacterium]